MTGASAQLTLMRQAASAEAGERGARAGHGEHAENDESGGHGSDRAFTAVRGITPEDGHVAHPATHARQATQAAPVRQSAPGHPAARPADVPRTRHLVESEIVGFVCDLVRAPRTTVGSVAPGLADAALVVLRGARDSRPGLRRPTLVLPESAHPAWFSAAAALGVVPVVIPVDAHGQAAVGPLTAAIGDETVLVVASAPSFTHGVVDPVSWIAAATVASGVPLHIDASAGGWSMAYARLWGRLGPVWGFDVPGVTSLTLEIGPERGVEADISVILHRRDQTRGAEQRADLRRRGPQAWHAAWRAAGEVVDDIAETLREIGHDTCAELALAALDATAGLARGMCDVRGVQLAAQPEATTITLRADATCDIFTFADGLHQRGWAAQPVVLESGVALLRLPVTAAMLPLVEECLQAIEAAAFDAQARGRAQIDPTLERLLEQLEPGQVSQYSARLLLDAAAVLDTSDPERLGRRAATQLLLQAAAPGVREELLVLDHERLNQPARCGVPQLLGGPDAADTSVSTEASE